VAEPRDQGGLEYLVKAGKLRSIGEEENQTPDQTQQQGLPNDPNANVDRSLEAFAARSVLVTIARLEQDGRPAGAGVKLDEVSGEVGMAGDLLIPLARRLAVAGAITVLEDDPFGNQKVTLTELGRQLLAQDATAELIRLIAASPS
jgi:hypothetical protein